MEDQETNIYEYYVTYRKHRKYAYCVFIISLALSIGYRFINKPDATNLRPPNKIVEYLNDRKEYYEADAEFAKEGIKKILLNNKSPFDPEVNMMFDDLKNRRVYDMQNADRIKNKIEEICTQEFKDIKQVEKKGFPIWNYLSPVFVSIFITCMALYFKKHWEESKAQYNHKKGGSAVCGK